MFINTTITRIHWVNHLKGKGNQERVIFQKNKGHTKQFNKDFISKFTFTARSISVNHLIKHITIKTITTVKLEWRTARRRAEAGNETEEREIERPRNRLTDYYRIIWNPDKGRNDLKGLIQCRFQTFDLITVFFMFMLAACCRTATVLGLQQSV